MNYATSDNSIDRRSPPTALKSGVPEGRPGRISIGIAFVLGRLGYEQCGPFFTIPEIGKELGMLHWKGVIGAAACAALAAAGLVRAGDADYRPARDELTLTRPLSLDIVEPATNPATPTPPTSAPAEPAPAPTTPKPLMNLIGHTPAADFFR